MVDGPEATEDLGPAGDGRSHDGSRPGGRNVEVVGTAPPVPDPAVVAAVRALAERLLETHEALDAFVERLDVPAGDPGAALAPE